MIAIETFAAGEGAGGRMVREASNVNLMRGKMRFQKGLAAAIAVAVTTTPTLAYELGSAGALQKPGITIGASAGDPPPGIYMFDQVFTYQANVTGPGNALLNPTGTKTGVQAAVDINGFLFAPGWSFLGATYTAVFAQPLTMASVGSPVNSQTSGVYNSFIVPVELSWKLGNSGFFVKAGLGMYVPDGTVTGLMDWVTSAIPGGHFNQSSLFPI